MTSDDNAEDEDEDDRRRTIHMTVTMKKHNCDDVDNQQNKA